MTASRAAYWFVAPALVLMVLILLVPIGTAAALSFTDYSLGNAGTNFVAVDNYEKIFTRSAYEKMFGATFRYVFVVVPLSVDLGLGAALLIHSTKRFTDLYKTIYFLPVMAALIAMAIVWEFALHPTIGIVNSTLEAGCGTFLENWTWYAKGCERTFPLWLTDRDYAHLDGRFHRHLAGFRLQHGALSRRPHLGAARTLPGRRNGRCPQRLGLLPTGYLADARADHGVRGDHFLHPVVPDVRHGRALLSARRRSVQIHLCHDVLCHDVRHLRKGHPAEPDGHWRRHHGGVPRLRHGVDAHPALAGRTQGRVHHS